MMRRTLFQMLAAIGAPVSGAQPRSLSASEFWDLYFRDAFLQLKRTADGWAGSATSSGHGLGVLDALRPQAAHSVWVSDEALRRYDDKGDARFDLFGVLDVSDEMASRSVAEAGYPYRSAAPYSPERMAAVMVELRRVALAPDPTTGVPRMSPASLAHWLHTALGAPGALTDQRITVAAWFLGERRNSAGTVALLDLLERSGRAQVSGSATDAAYVALWKIADRASISPLLLQMERASETSRWKYARLFERLLSTDTLLSAGHLGDAYARPDAWISLVGREQLGEEAAWKRLQSRALRWELRALLARRLAQEDSALARLLATDSVAAVRRAAQAQLR